MPLAYFAVARLVGPVMKIHNIGFTRSLWAGAAFIVTNVFSVITWIYFFALNRVQIVRPYCGDSRPNLIFVCNHQAPLDSFLIGLVAFFPRTLFQPRLHPWSFAASQHFFRNRVVAWLSHHLRCIAVGSGGDARALRTMCRILPSGVTVLFPEGRRSPNGIVGRGLPGAGFLALRTGARIVPVAIEGLLSAMPYHAPWPRIGKRMSIAFGDPVPYDDLLTGQTTREIAQAIVDRSMEAVNRLHQELLAISGERSVRSANRRLQSADC